MSSDKNCEEGFTLRKEYTRRNYTRKNGVAIKTAHVPSTCVPTEYKQSGLTDLNVLGYKVTNDIKVRHEALDEAVKEYGFENVQRELIRVGKGGPITRSITSKDIEYIKQNNQRGGKDESSKPLHLSHYGYYTDKSDAVRRKALREASKVYTPIKVQGRLVLLSNLSQNGSRAKSIMKNDVNYTKKLYAKYKEQQGGVVDPQKYREITQNELGILESKLQNEGNSMSSADKSKLETRIWKLQKREKKLEHPLPKAQADESNSQEALQIADKDINELLKYKRENKDVDQRLDQLKKERQYLSNPQKYDKTYAYGKLLTGEVGGADKMKEAEIENIKRSIDYLKIKRDEADQENKEGITNQIKTLERQLMEIKMQRGGLECEPGYIERSGYNRKKYERRAYTKSSGIEIPEVEVKETYVEPTCTPKRGKYSGTQIKGPKTLPDTSRSQLHLRDFGYSVHAPESERQTAIKQAMNNFEPLEVLRHLVLDTNKQAFGAPSKKIMQEDVDYAKREYAKYKAKYKGGAVDELKEETQELCQEGKCDIKKEIYEKHKVNGHEWFFVTLDPAEYDDMAKLIDDEDLPENVKENQKKSVKEGLERFPGYYIGLWYDGEFEGYFNYRLKPKSNEIAVLLSFRCRQGYREALLKFVDRFFQVNGFKRIETDLHASEQGNSKFQFLIDNGYIADPVINNRLPLHKDF